MSIKYLKPLFNTNYNNFYILQYKTIVTITHYLVPTTILNIFKNDK